MPSSVSTPAQSAAIDRLTLTTEGVRGTEGAAFLYPCVCSAHDAE